MGLFTKRKIKKAQELLDFAISLKENQEEEAIKIYDEVIKLRPDWSTPYYNLGLLYKYRNDWEQSLYYNTQSVKLDYENEAGWWNLGIAATVLNKWEIAREAWSKCGVEIEINKNEPNMQLGNTPIRLNPNSNPEVIWAKRIDPARAIILNVPFPSSGRRYSDIVLNDGAPQGYKIVGEIEYAILNELELIKKSDYKTYSCDIYTSDPKNIEELTKICEQSDIEMEDWSTVRYFCKKCSEGITHESHDHDLKEKDKNLSAIGFALTDVELLKEALQKWYVITLCEYDNLKLELE